MTSPVQGISVRNIISLFENQAVDDPIKERRNLGLKRTKSLGSISKKPITITSDNFAKQGSVELSQIEMELNVLEQKITNYQTYAKETHIYYQNELLTLLTDIVNIESLKDVADINRKRDLIDIIKLLNKSLNALLPTDLNKATNKTSTLTVTLGAKPSDLSTASEEPSNISEVPSNKEENVVHTTDNVAVNTGIPSVKKLRHLFEQKSSENDGLRVLVKEKAPRKYLTFNGNSCDVKYVPYRDLQQAAVTDRYIVDSESFKDNRVVHNTGIYRSNSRTQELKALFESIDSISKNGAKLAQFNNHEEETKLADRTIQEQELAHSDKISLTVTTLRAHKNADNGDVIVNGVGHGEIELLEGEGITKV